MLNFPCPRIWLVAVGITNAGPPPQISLPGLAGDRKNVGFISPKPYWPPVGSPGYGCHTIGWIMRVMRVQFSARRAGITGWMLSTSWVRSFEPIPKLLLFWMGTLIRLATGFCVAFCNASVLLVAAAVCSVAT